MPTAAAKIAAEVVASPLFYLVAGEVSYKVLVTIASSNIVMACYSGEAEHDSCQLETDVNAAFDLRLLLYATCNQ